MNVELNRDKTVAIDETYKWRGMEVCPVGVKVLLKTEGGVAILGIYRNGDKGYLSWAPLPTN